MLARLANLGIRYPRRVLGIAALLLVAAAAFGGQVQKHLSAGGFSDPGAASSRANDLLADRFHAGDPNLLLEVTSPGGVDSPAARTEGRRLVTALGVERYASRITSYWTTGSSALRSDDGRSGLVVARVAGDDNQSPKRAAAIVDRITRNGTPGTTVAVGGIAMAYHQVTDQVTEDLKIAEVVAVPLTVIVLIWVFGSFIAALLPLAVGIFSIIGTLAVLRAIAAATHVSIYAMNLTTALGLALAIDYSLFIVSRYREEIAKAAERGAPTVGPGALAIERTMQTAGRTVLFSALTVALSLAALLVFPVYFLRSFAYSGIAVVALAAVAALAVLPALLRLLGPRVNALDLRVPVRRWLRRPPPKPITVEQSFWYRLASGVMRRALPIGLAVVAVLLVLGGPFLGVKFGYPDDRVLPTSASAHQVGDALRDRFGANAGGPVTVVVPDMSRNPDAVGTYAAALSDAPGVINVVSSAGTFAGGRPVAAGDPTMSTGNAAYLVANTTADPMSDAGQRVLHAVQDTPTPWPVQVTGTAAENADSLHSLASMLPLAIALIALATFVLLFLFTGSVVLPLKALVLNTLSLTATFGAMVWIFQDGHFANVYDATVTGFLVPTMPILMFCLSFGMSMDYEVFLLSRIREEWLATGDNSRAVAVGLGRTGRIVTAAALLMAIVFAALATGKVSFMAMFGTGLTLAVLMDATLVRGVLVPSFMKLAGRANWWAPGPLARWHRRFGLSEAPEAPKELVPA
ncbi:MAG TPA: MMPL family transporter [Jatrophihabitantaceae bacterium]